MKIPIRANDKVKSPLWNRDQSQGNYKIAPTRDAEYWWLANPFSNIGLSNPNPNTNPNIDKKNWANTNPNTNIETKIWAIRKRIGYKFW